MVLKRNTMCKCAINTKVPTFASVCVCGCITPRHIILDFIQNKGKFIRTLIIYIFAASVLTERSYIRSFVVHSFPSRWRSTWMPNDSIYYRSKDHIEEDERIHDKSFWILINQKRSHDLKVNPAIPTQTGLIYVLQPALGF